jgi:hypothetical protein
MLHISTSSSSENTRDKNCFFGIDYMALKFLIEKLAIKKQQSTV